MKKLNVIITILLVLTGNIFAQNTEIAKPAASAAKPLIGIPNFENRTEGHATRIVPGKYKEKNVNIGYDNKRETFNDDGKNMQTESHRKIYDKQLERKVEFAPGEWKLPESAGKIAADEVATVLNRSDRFRLLSRSKFSFISRDDERKNALLRGSTEDYMKLCKDLNAKYLILGSISGFRVDEAKGTAYGVDLKRISTRISLDIKAINVATGEIAYQDTQSKSVTVPLPSGVKSTEFYDWKKSLRIAVREAADVLVLGLAKGVGASVVGLQTVKLEVKSTPKGADIIVDKDFMGNTPTTISVNEGRHMISIELQGYKPWKRSVKAYDGFIINPTLEKFSVPPQVKETKN